MFHCGCNRDWYVKRRGAGATQEEAEAQAGGRPWKCPKCDPVPFANRLELGLAFLLCGIKGGKVF